VVPQEMIRMVKGVGEFVIKFGGPPVLTRLSGGRLRESGVRYEWERGVWKVEYVRARPSSINVASNPTSNTSAANSAATTSSRTEENDSSSASGATTPPDTSPTIECEIRCDLDTWASSLDIVVDPPPQAISCLRRHKLSSEGGGLWITITHDAGGLMEEEERHLVIVRRGPDASRLTSTSTSAVGGGAGSSGGEGNREGGSSKEAKEAKENKGVVMVNGTRVNVDVEEMRDEEVRMMRTKRRVKPERIPLDQPPVAGVIRRRKTEEEGQAVAFSSTSPTSDKGEANTSGGSGANGSGWLPNAPKMSSPLARFFSYAVSGTGAQVGGISGEEDYNGLIQASSSKPPTQYVLDALAWTKQAHARHHSRTDSGWVLVSDKSALPIHRKHFSAISRNPSISVHRGWKVIELAVIIREGECRKGWDER
jgi:hypothetical protein